LYIKMSGVIGRTLNEIGKGNFDNISASDLTTDINCLMARVKLAADHLKTASASSLSDIETADRLILAADNFLHTLNSDY
jgi:hypothetical protein